MSLELAQSMDTDEMVNAIQVFDESKLDNRRYSGSKMFRCLDCEIQLTLVNYGKKNIIQKPRFEPSKRTGHHSGCTMVNGTSEEIANLLKAIVPNLNDSLVKNLSKNENRIIDIVDKPKKNSTSKITKKTNLSNEDQLDAYNNYSRNNHAIKGFHGSKISGLGTVYSIYHNDKEALINSIHWKGSNSSIIKKFPFKINEIVTNISNKPIENMKTKIYFGNFNISFTNDKSKFQLTAVKSFNSLTQIKTIWISVSDIKGFYNVSKIYELQKNQGSQIKVVLCGSFYSPRNQSILLFYPLSNNDINSWLFLPD